MQVEIRPLEVDDIAALQRIDEQAHGEAWSRATLIDQIEHDHFTHLVAVDETNRVRAHAATWLDGATIRVTNVACDEAARGHGLATRLLAKLLASDSSTSFAEASLEVRPANRTAQRLYSRFGFAPAGIIRDFYDRSDRHGNRDALVMRVVDTTALEWIERIDELGAPTSLPANTEGALT